MIRTGIVQVVILIFLFTLISCSTKKKIIKPIDRPESDMEILWKKIEASNIDFTWYHGKAKALVEFDGFSVSGKTDIRIRKDCFFSQIFCYQALQIFPHAA